MEVNVYQVRIYRHRECDEMEIRTGSSDSNSSRQESDSFDRVQRRSSESQYSRKKGSDGLRKKYREDEIVMPSTSGYNLKPRRGAKVESRPAIELKTQQGGPVRARKSRENNYSPYISKSKQGQAARIPEEVVNTRIARKGKEEQTATDQSPRRS
ncbi:uncharacterized protein TNCV_3840612 [Trichonephila clavipes]|nr:uncharacterized protein TNCV_3840612 [Trichonephila clavipes]